jgi:hypothetical protein
MNLQFATTTQIVWGPVAVWVSAVATFLTVGVALLGGFGWFTRHSHPRLELSFEQTQPWYRHVGEEGPATAQWVRVAVDNHGVVPARGCVGRLIGLATDDVPRADIDPVQLRWAGVPRSRSFQPIDIRRGQREFLNIVLRSANGDWLIETFGDTDFDPGFPTHLRADQVHALKIALFADNAETDALDLRLEVVDGQPRITTVHSR